jgi:hypothetical protein
LVQQFIILVCCDGIFLKELESESIACDQINQTSSYYHNTDHELHVSECGVPRWVLILLTLVGNPHADEVTTESSNQKTYVPYCQMTHPDIQTALYVIHALLLGTSLRLCWSLREVPKKFSDFHTIGSGEFELSP